MTHPELGAALQLLRSLILGAFFFRWLSMAAAAGRLDGEVGLILLGKAGLIFVAATVAAGMVLQIATLISAYVSGAESRPGEPDERDKLIELRALQHGFTACSFGFLGLLLAFWLGYGLIAGFAALMLGFTLADLLVNGLKFRAYRRGRPG